MNYSFLGNIIISGSIICETGLHIGGTTKGYEIGGMDNPILKDPITDYPYIPGSSLKGKMRSLLEWSKGLIQLNEKSDGKKKTAGDIHSCGSSTCIVCRIFGTPAQEERQIGPTRLLVRDAYPDEKTKANLDRLEQETGLPKAEWKTENNINRITSAATPRNLERVPQGSAFNFEIVYGIYSVEGDSGLTDIEYLKHVFEGMRLLQDSALGGYSSRGSGKIFFDLKGSILLRTVNDYEKGLEGTHLDIASLEKINFAELKEKLIEKLS